MRAGTGVTSVLAVAVITVAAACSQNPRSGSGSPSDRITHEELVSVADARNLWDAVQRLRPRWLTPEGGVRYNLGSSGTVLYQDQTFLGDSDMLRQFSPDVAYELRWLDGVTAAASLPGLGSVRVHGAIVIYTRPR